MTAPRLVLKPDPRQSGSPLRWLVPLLAGFGVGVALALTLAWDIMTPAPVAGTVSGLRSSDKERYIVVVSMSYALHSDLATAQGRLALLEDSDIQGTVRNLAERYTNELKPVAQRSSLAKLAMALGADSVTLRVYVSTTTPSAQSSLAASSPVPTLFASPLPTSVPSPTPSQLDYQVFERTRLTCQQDPGPKPRISIFIQDTDGKGLPGIHLRIQWDDGEDTLFTGLKGTDPGYAEYEVQPGKSYSVAVIDGTSQTALGLDADSLDASCPSDGKDHFRAWRVIFRRMG